MKFPKIFFVFLLPLLFFGCASHRSTGKTPTLVLISIDSYRPDYTQRFQPPNLARLMLRGAVADGLKPIYPSKTFPNHYALITGLYAEHHGIVANEFYDPTFDAIYALSDASAVRDGRWYSGVPLWNLAEQNGVKAACYFWPGSEAAIGGRRPSYFYNYNVSTPNVERVDQVLKWLQLPERERPHFVTLYFSTVDTAAHKYGPLSEQTRQAVLEVDQMLGRLQAGLDKLEQPVDVVVVSDHGMEQIDSTKIEFVDEKADLSDFLILGDGTHTLLYLKHGKDKSIIEKTLKAFAKTRHQFRAYAREQTPRKWHYRDNLRIGDIVLEEQPPYYMQVHSKPPKIPEGNHGYDPDINPNMLGVFYAWGPQIRKSIHLHVINNVHVYPFLARLLQLPLPPNIDGDPTVLETVLRQ